ncbi:hemin receptor [Loktanella sp. D2R18]|uniref:globin family protein n=1 Tax=Rhodobacterales TaxID=204455 RepID=UPI000DEA0D68|nr:MULTISPECIES: globin family protein [Rhodobacterales]MDO6589270.1 globin family protein [Yoonia sp. 1_MG-2023]RBW45308.1 hemin receptor [Loktanella sp. D2R18]
MNESQITLVQDSFAKVAPIKDAAAEIFYNRLFEVAPQVRPMFKDDVTEQGAKLMATLGVVVNGLRDLNKIVPVAEALAVKHIDYGVKAEHYDTVGASLLYTLKAGLGDDFTAEVEDAWATAYTTLAGVMINAAYKHAAE